MLKNYEEIASFGRDNVQALVQSGTLAAKGIEELAKAYAAFADANYRKASAAAQALSVVKSPNEFLQLQAQLVRDNADSLVVESGKMAEIVKSVVITSFEPIQARVNAAAQLYKTAA